MGTPIDEALRKLRALAAEVAPPHWTAPAWGGAGVAVTSTPQEPAAEGSFYGVPRYVVTRHAPQLSWLFTQVWDAFRPHMDSQSKFEFFGRLANAANRYLDQAGESESPHDLLVAVLYEAFAIADEVGSGQFSSLMVAVDGEVEDDRYPDAERLGYANVADARRFIAEQAAKA